MIVREEADTRPYSEYKAAKDVAHRARMASACFNDASDEIQIYQARATPIFTCPDVREVVAVYGPNDTFAISSPAMEVWVSQSAAIAASRARLTYKECYSALTSTTTLLTLYGSSYAVSTELPPSPHATVNQAIPEIQIADPFAGYDAYADANWDGYTAQPISADTISAARMFWTMLPPTLGEPHVSPNADGTISFEWVLKNRPLRKLFIDVGPSLFWGGYWRRATGETQTMTPKVIDVRTEAELAVLFDKLSQ